MLVLNFTHPLTEEQCRWIEALAATQIEEVRTFNVQIKQEEPLEVQIVSIVDSTGLSSEEWQTRPLLVNPPGYAPAAFALLAELHGRIGHFPSLVRLRPKPGPVTSYEVAELLNLQTIREAARARRFSSCGSYRIL
ncbi:MAG TPA: CRISPR-associated protein Csx15 [Ktedonobacteraceae bacterium]|nr:CRISPR-associated protein Csx15 [Ktedonobacteraceae bacterium]